MGDEEESPLEGGDDKNPIKEEILEEEGKKLSRDIARKHIYVKNKERYPLPFEEYKIYHIDGKLFNDSPDNLYLCTKEQRNALYAEQLRRGKPFSSSKEIDLFLGEIGKVSPEISKDKKIYEKTETKIPLYWRQRETRRKQAPLPDPHPELRKNIIREIREAEDRIEEKKEESRFYTLPPKRHPELRERLIEEIKETEDKQKGVHRRRLSPLEKVIILVGIMAILILFAFILKDTIFKKYEEIPSEPFNISKSQLNMGNSTEQIFNYEIRTERYYILVVNNKDKELNLEIMYNRYSEALDVNENKTVRVHVPANDEVLLEDPGFSRDLGCLKEECDVAIISSEKF